MRTFLLPACALTVLLVACGGDDTSVVTDAGTDTSTKQDTGTQDTGTQDTGTKDTGAQDSGADVVVDSGPQPVNGCTSFTDATAQNDPRAISFPTGLSAAQYTPNCIKIKVGQSVTWNGSFTNHPLMPFNGDSNNPVTTTSSGTTKSFTFPAAGTYGFACQFHSFAMFGAIQVVP